MIKIQIPYKSHSNKLMWDYNTQFCGQLNNINFANKLTDPEAEFDNVIFVVVDCHDSTLHTAIGLSQQNDEGNFEVCCSAWATMAGVFFSGIESESGVHVFSFDIKKYNSVLSFAEEYQSRDTIKLFMDTENNKLFYKVSDNNFVDVSPIYVGKELKNKIINQYDKYKRLNIQNMNHRLRVDSVDKNSFLLPFMSYRDFVNFSSYSTRSEAYLLSSEDRNWFVNKLVDKNGRLNFYMETALRDDKFFIDASEDTKVPSSLWQILVLLQHFKAWKQLHLYEQDGDFVVCIDFDLTTDQAIVTHLVDIRTHVDKLEKPCLDKFELVGRQHSNDLFRINKLYSNANRTCYFDFSTQTFTGNNYVFNDNKLEPKTIELSTPVDAKLPLKITYTEIKHYIGSDLSQKNFVLHIYTDGINVILERWNNEDTVMDCRILFNHEMSKKNQNLTVI